MKVLNDIIKNIDIEKLIGEVNIPISAINFDSRKIADKHLFIAIKGTQHDGHKFINTALNKGATTIVCEELPGHLQKNITYVKVKYSAKALGIIASNYFDNPSSKLKLVGITGTNGKTTIATLLYRLFRKSGYKSGLLSTIHNYINDKIIQATYTTPDAIQINSLLNDMVNQKCEYCFMEVSSHSIVQNRITGLNFSGGIFTNISHEHLDYHKTFNQYLKSKKLFFDNLPDNAFTLINIDDAHGKIILQNTKAKKYTYAMKSYADFKCKVLESNYDGMLLNFDGVELSTHFIGSFNAYNLLSVYAGALLLGLQKQEVLTIISELQAVDGRFEFIHFNNSITAIIDYAHTPDALNNVLLTINQIKKQNQLLITVVGAGGDRDKTKRPLMAKVVAQLSDKVIFTSDNPRSEKPEDIIKQMNKGVEPQYQKKIISIIDRREAIKTACFLANKGDIILIAGKGHEHYQEVNGVKYPFNDKEEINRHLVICK